MAKLGDKGTEVTEVQKLLSMLGYDLIIDGDFGAKTVRSLQAFQKKMGLTVDGVAGPKTIEALKAAQKRTAKEEKGVVTGKNYGDLSIETKYQLESVQYIKQTISKDKIFIHFTAGGPSAVNVIKYWGSDETRVATAFVIDGDKGQIFECFNPDFWSFHLGIKNTNGALDKTSIGIEICAWGPLTKKGDKYYTYVNTEVPASQVYELDTPFRGFKYFHKVSDAQFEQLELLLDYLITEYNIPVQKSFDLSWFEFQQDVIDKKTPGLWTHTTVRKDKSDMYPDKKLLEILNRLAKKHNP
jgi:N-acetyl-anhydromuramyl-L-alanine amidase AmpD